MTDMQPALSGRNVGRKNQSGRRLSLLLAARCLRDPRRSWQTAMCRDLSVASAVPPASAVAPKKRHVVAIRVAVLEEEALRGFGQRHPVGA